MEAAFERTHDYEIVRWLLLQAYHLWKDVKNLPQMKADLTVQMKILDNTILRIK